MERLFQWCQYHISNAQISFPEACFYLKAGQDIKSSEKIAAILYKGDKLYVANTHATITYFFLTQKATGGIKNRGQSFEWGAL